MSNFNLLKSRHILLVLNMLILECFRKNETMPISCFVAHLIPTKYYLCIMHRLVAYIYTSVMDDTKRAVKHDIAEPFGVTIFV